MMLNASSQSLPWLTLNQYRPNFGPNHHDYQIWMCNMACERPFASARVAIEQAHAAGDHLNRPRPGKRVSPNDQLPSGSIA